jgi:hypothetical protein
MEYESQLEQKSTDMTNILKKITSSVWKASAHKPISWTKEYEELLLLLVL